MIVSSFEEYKITKNRDRKMKDRVEGKKATKKGRRGKAASIKMMQVQSS